MTRLIHITDLHFWRIVLNPMLLMNKRFLGNMNLALRRRRYVRTELAERFLTTLWAIKADALLVGGDLTTTATEAEYELAAAFLDRIAEMGVPIYLTPGNHDLYTFESLRRKRFESYLGKHLAEPHAPALLPLPNGAPLLRLPTARPNLISSRGHIRLNQIEKVRELLGTTDVNPLIVLAHYPLLAHTDAYRLGAARRLGNAAFLRALLGASGRSILYLAGHVHAFSRVRDPLYPNIEHATTGALFYTRAHAPGGFTEIQADDGAFALRSWILANKQWSPLTPLSRL